MTTIYRALALDAPDDPFAGGALRAEPDAGILVCDDGLIADRGPFTAVRARNPAAEVCELSGGLLLPGFVDTHVHFPQTRIIGGLGMPLLEWLERCALPEEARMAERAYAEAIAAEFVSGLTDAGTTTALVFGAHFAPAVDALFEAASERGLRVTSGLVVSDRCLRPELHTTAQQAYDEGLSLARRWHGRGRNRYAVIPRFALSCSDELLASCAALQEAIPGSWLTSHVNENPAEVAAVEGLFGCSYVESYHRHDLIGPRTVLAHNVHPTDPELECLAAGGATVAHCPTSNASLGSGLFPLERHLAHRVPVSLGTDVGGGTGYCMFKEGLQAYFMQQLRGPRGVALTAVHLLYLATTAGAVALGLDDQIGGLGIGKRFDALWLRPPPGSSLDAGLRHADGPEQALARAFALGVSSDVSRVWIDGENVKRTEPSREMITALRNTDIV
ncbi:MAG TPA: guanine deaminase [Solirubrobacteraceae bacterium]|nr:guanine deaminase [Solirubrobacteraceae bacterium]